MIPVPWLLFAWLQVLPGPGVSNSPVSRSQAGTVSESEIDPKMELFLLVSKDKLIVWHTLRFNNEVFLS